jgi:glycosyltransferase involved in cell wall biosynthesis
MTRVLFLPRHDVQAASCRHRYIQFLPYLEQRGLDCDVSPFFDAQYTRSLLAGDRKEWWRIGSFVTRRLRTLLAARRYDLIVIQAELIPFFPDILEQALHRLGVPYVLDFDDAFFHQYDQHRLRLIQWTLGNKLCRIMRRARLNCAGSEYLRAYASRCSLNVAIVPTVVDLCRYPTSSPSGDAAMFRIGWIGSPTTTPHLRTIVPELRDFCRGRHVEIIAIGAKPFDTGGLPMRWVEWSEATEVRELAQCAVGIMPLPSTSWASGKCGFKLIQAMACWLPVVASPVGENCRIVEHGTTGFLAGAGEWSEVLENLYRDPGLRTRLGAAGRRTVEREYSLQAWAPRLADLLKSAAS